MSFTKWFEFKENWFEPHALGEYISGMSNAAAMVGEEYAYFVWGVENNTHIIKGTTVRGKVILQPQGKEFFTWRGKNFFTSCGNDFFT